MLDLQWQCEQVRAEVLATVGRVCASQHYILGSEVEAFERELADFCGGWLWLSLEWSQEIRFSPRLSVFCFGKRHRARLRASSVCRYRSANFESRSRSRRIFSTRQPARQTPRAAPGSSLRPVRRHGWFQRLADEFHLSLIEDAAQTIWSALGKRAE
jgi:hypothetical protein